jgi:hypothetical protein
VHEQDITLSFRYERLAFARTLPSKLHCKVESWHPAGIPRIQTEVRNLLAYQKFKKKYVRNRILLAYQEFKQKHVIVELEAAPI